MFKTFKKVYILKMNDIIVLTTFSCNSLMMWTRSWSCYKMCIYKERFKTYILYFQTIFFIFKLLMTFNTLAPLSQNLSLFLLQNFLINHFSQIFNNEFINTLILNIFLLFNYPLFYIFHYSNFFFSSFHVLLGVHFILILGKIAFPPIH